MRLVNPPGARSCRDGGTGDFARNAAGATSFFAELASILDHLPETSQANLREDIHRKMRRASEGKLRFGKNEDVDQMVSAPTVLEIRIIDHFSWAEDDPDQEPLKRHTRIYFTEPEPIDRCLLELFVASKCPGPEGLDEQNQDVQVAARRADEHCNRR